MIIDQLVFVVFVVVCGVYLSASSMTVLADKIFTFGLVYLILIPHQMWVGYADEFKFIFGAKDLFIYSALVSLGANRTLKKAYLLSVILNLGILSASFLLPSKIYKDIYYSYPYAIQFVSALQLVGIYSGVTDGRNSNGNSWGRISNFIRCFIGDTSSKRLLRVEKT